MTKFFYFVFFLSTLLTACGQQSNSKKIIQPLTVSETIISGTDTKNENITKVILGYCINSVPRLEKVEAAARMFSWRELTKDQATMLAPMDPNAWFKGWFVQDEAIGRYSVGIARSKLDGKKMASCSVATDDADVDTVVSKLVDVLQLNNQTVDENIGGQRSRIWRTNHPTPGTLIIVVDIKGMNESVFSISITTPDI